MGSPAAHDFDPRDGALFSIDADGNLSMNIVPDYERPQDD